MCKKLEIAAEKKQQQQQQTNKQTKPIQTQQQQFKSRDINITSK